MYKKNASRTLFAVALAGSLMPAALSAAPDATGKPLILTRLGGSHAFVKPPLKTGDDLKKLFSAKRADLEEALRMGNWDGNAADLFDAVAAGRFEERSYPAGTTIKWMAMRERKKVKLITDATWGGKAPFEGFYLTVTSNDVKNEFVVPKACGNLALLGSTPLPPPVAKVSASPLKDCITRNVSIDAGASSVSYGSIASVSGSITGPDGKSEDLGASASGWKWSRTSKVPGKYKVTVVATADSGRKSEPATVEFELTPCPPTCTLVLSAPDAWSDEEFSIDASGSKAQVTSIKTVHVTIVDDKGASVAQVDVDGPGLKLPYKLSKGGDYKFTAVAEDELGQKSSNSCEAPIRIFPKATILADFFGGKERRVRPEFEGGRCAPLLGTKVGLSYMPNRRWEWVLAPGFAFNTRDSENYSLFVDAELNRHWPGSFAGIGIGAWDITHGDDPGPGLSPVGLLQFGFDLKGTSVGRRPAQLFFQGRLPFDELDDISNNYMFMAGFRFHIE